jgi:glycosyltransferase involved in cell wall biosynthesis
VLFAVASLDRAFGGPALKSRALGAALRARGHQVVLAGAAAEAVDGGLPLPPLWRFRGTPWPAGLRHVAAAAAAADIVHVIGYRDPVGTAAALAARRRRVPYVVEPAGMHRRRLRSFALKAAFDATLGRLVMGGAARVVATSAVERDELIADGVRADRIAVRANGVEHELLDAAAPSEHAAAGIPAGVPYVLALGRLTRKKNLPAVARAVAGLEGVHLVIAGPDSGDGTRGELEWLAAGPMAGRLHLVTGGVWGVSRRALFAAASLFVLWSATENFGTAALEAAACGVPVVVSEHCGVAQWLGAGAAVVPLGGEEGLREGLRAILGDAARRRRMAEAGRAAAQRLTWPALAGQQEQMYVEILA